MSSPLPATLPPTTMASPAAVTTTTTTSLRITQVTSHILRWTSSQRCNLQHSFTIIPFNPQISSWITFSSVENQESTTKENKYGVCCQQTVTWWIFHFVSSAVMATTGVWILFCRFMQACPCCATERPLLFMLVLLLLIKQQSCEFSCNSSCYRWMPGANC